MSMNDKLDEFATVKEYRALLEPQEGILCAHCAEEYEDHIDKRTYTLQTPVSILVRYSEPPIYFKGVTHRSIDIFMETRCEKCSKLNKYPLWYWKEDKVKKHNERIRAKQDEADEVG